MPRTQPDFLKRLVKIAGPSISSFARRLNMPQTLVNNYCRGKTAPGYEFFKRLAEQGVDLHWLLTGKEQPKQRGPGRIPEIPEKLAFFIQELKGDADGMIGLEGMIEGYVRARRRTRRHSKEGS